MKEPLQVANGPVAYILHRLIFPIHGGMKMNQHMGDLIVTDMTIISSGVSGIAHVRPGGHLIASGALSGGLKIDAGANAVVSGTVGRNSRTTAILS